MSDTKALYDVVGKALANWGNGEAQDALETLMGRLRDVEKEREEDQGVIRVWRGRCGRAEADNAALLTWVNANAHRIGDRLCPYTGGYACEPGCMAHGIHTQPHPGAALLEELEGLRKQVELQKAVISGLQDGIEEGKAAAHNAALEEAAKVAQSEFDHGDESDRVRDYFANVVTAIRALKKTGQGE